MEAQPDHQEEGRAGAETERYCGRLLVDDCWWDPGGPKKEGQPCMRAPHEGRVGYKESKVKDHSGMSDWQWACAWA